MCKQYADDSTDIYADDSTFSVSGDTIEELEIKLNVDLTNVQQWCQVNKMALNAYKTKIMLVTNYQKEAKLSSSVINVNFNEFWYLTGEYECWEIIRSGDWQTP